MENKEKEYAKVFGVRVQHQTKQSENNIQMQCNSPHNTPTRYSGKIRMYAMRGGATLVIRGWIDDNERRSILYSEQSNKRGE